VLLHAQQSACGEDLIKNDLKGQEGRNTRRSCASTGHLRTEMTGCVLIKKFDVFRFHFSACEAGGFCAAYIFQEKQLNVNDSL